jgi:hypothetical protein
MTPTVKHVADGIVIGGLLKCTMTPIVAIFSGQLWGFGAFLAGAIIVSTVMFGEVYFREV